VRTFAERSPVPDLGLAEGALLLGPLLHLAFEEAALQDLHGLLLFWSWLFSFWHVTTRPSACA
jgi:hypothetical protein